MTVSWRHTLATGTAMVLSAAVTGIALAQNSGHVVSVPGVTIGSSSAPTTSNCCIAGQVHSITPPGVSVPGPNLVYAPGQATVGNQFIVGGGAEVGVSVSGYADTRTTFLSNGSYIPMADPVPPSTLDLNVAGSTQHTEVVQEQVAVQEEVCVPQIQPSFALFPVQAVCLDDTGTPHPASRVDDSERVGGDYSGEVFRCMAGTSMQVTIGELVEGQISFANASGFSCAKGEALVHLPGGELQCAPQAPRRDCNERSLLRRYGPGLKLVETSVQRQICVPEMQTRMETVQREVVVDRPLDVKPITLNGGVGQIVTY